MNYADFKNSTQNLPIILTKSLSGLKFQEQTMLNQLYRWQKKRLIIQLKRGVYLLNKNDRKIKPSRVFIASQLYNPSYVSMEYALSFYGLIPERVADITSITTKKTTKFKNELGDFVYQHIKPETFRGFKSVKDESGYTYFIAEKEKAVVDLFYLNLNKINSLSFELFEKYFRFQAVEGLKQKKIIEFAKLFNNSKLMRLVKLFCTYIKEVKK